MHTNSTCYLNLAAVVEPLDVVRMWMWSCGELVKAQTAAATRLSSGYCKHVKRCSVSNSLVNGTQTSGLQFVRANGSSLDVEVQAEEGYLFMQFLWTISFGRYTRCITAPEDCMMNGVFPLNPLVLLNYARGAMSKGM